MSFSDLKKNLPALNGVTLDFVFDHVYAVATPNEERHLKQNHGEKVEDLLRVLMALQEFNYRHRMDQVSDVLDAATRAGRRFQSNSTGTELWLALLLALQELYGLSNHELERVVKQISIVK